MSDLINHAKTNLVNAGIGSDSPLYCDVMELILAFTKQDHARTPMHETVNLFNRLGRFENLPHRSIKNWDGKLDGLKSWQKTILAAFPRSEFVELPDFIRNQSAMWRFATYEDFWSDTVHHGGTVMATGLSMLFRPKTIVEFGVHGGFTTLQFCKLNPSARVHAVDIHSRLPDGLIPICTGAMMQMVKNLSIHIMPSWEFRSEDVDLCFIDGDHTGDAPMKDSWRAWENRNKSGDWCIAWDGYHKDNPDVWNAVNAFAKETGYHLNKIGSWVWIGTKTQKDLDDIIL